MGLEGENIRCFGCMHPPTHMRVGSTLVGPTFMWVWGYMHLKHLISPRLEEGPQYLPFPQNLLRGKELNPCPSPISYARQVQISISSYKHHKEKNASHLALYYYKFCKSLHFLGTLSSMIAFMYALSIIFISPLFSDLK